MQNSQKLLFVWLLYELSKASGVGSFGFVNPLPFRLVFVQKFEVKIDCLDQNSQEITCSFT